MKDKIVVGVDFDGTVVTHDFPRVGVDIGAVPVLKKLLAKGHKIVLNTMRSGKELQEAVIWFENNDIPLYGVNKNPTQHTWTSSPKVYAQLYIDDAALGTPLLNDAEMSNRPFVDWGEVETLLLNHGLI
jgi:hypothetical protein